MRLFLSDTFQENVLELPKAVQKKITAFLKKFRECTTTNGIHLEPIMQFKNDNLRTARVDDNYRAVIGVLDDNYYLLFVGAHEAAYNWGMRKRFSMNDYTQTVQIVNVQEATETVAKSAPTIDEKPSVLSGVHYEQRIKIGAPEDMIGLGKAMKTLDDLDSLEEYLPADAYENLFNLLDGTPITDIISEMEEGLAKENEDKLLSNNNKRRFVELTDDDALQRIIEQDMDKWQIFLHPSQRKLVDADYKGSMKVSGGAGTGKTIAALHRLKHLCEMPGAKVLFTTYTKTLKENLEGLVKKMDVDPVHYTLKNIDKVLMDCAKEYGIKSGYTVLDYAGDNESLKLWSEILEAEVTEFNEKFLYDEYVDVILYFGNTNAKQYMLQQRVGRTKALSRKQRLDVWRLVEKYVALKNSRKLVDRLELFNETAKYMRENNVHPYTNVIADEFQDFSNPELKFLRALVVEGRNDLFLTGDPLQRIYQGRRINFESAGINVRGVRSMRLKVNYRTTEPIKRVAVSVVKGQKYDDLDEGTENIKGYVSLIRGGEKPTYEMLTNANEEVTKVLEKIAECKQDGIDYKDICVAATSTGHMKELQSQLHTNGTSYKVLKDGSKQGESNGLSLCTFHSLKGLEFKVVILMGVNERNIPSKATNDYPFSSMNDVEKKEFLSSRRSLLYVAITRARQLVFMTGYGEPCKLLESLRN